jgi:Uma2 family endonuclease
MGWLESILASELGHLLSQHVKSRKLGLISGEQAPIRLRLGLVRMPDIAFTAWSRIPGKPADVAPIAPIIPNLAVEILSLSNTRAEMTRKCQEYFAAGVELVWIIDPAARTIEIYTAPGGPVRTLTHADTLTGDPVLPQFSMRIADLFAGLDRPDLPAGAGQRE